MAKAREFPTADADRATRQGNIAPLASRWSPLRELAMAAGIGVLLAASFAPLEWAFWPWFGMAPLLYLIARPNARAARIGYCFGLAHFTTCFGWLREVFILAPLGCALVYAILPALWAVAVQSSLRVLERPAHADLLPQHQPDVKITSQLTATRQVALVLFIAASWVAIEWVRSWLFSGFPWNQLGVSQWQSPLLLLSRLGGVYPLSFLLLCVNAAIFLRFYRPDARYGNSFRPSPWPLVVAGALALGGWGLAKQLRQSLPAPTATVRVAAVQGNIPQSRMWSQEQLDTALAVYTGLTRTVVREQRPELVVWPETAIPASLIFNAQCRAELAALLSDIQTPLVAGTITMQFPPPGSAPDTPPKTFNSAVLFDANGVVAAYYNKIHLVPFGEYVPFERYFPWLNRLIGMGRSLTAGREHTVIPFGEHARFGFNICFEDVFPEISAQLAYEGANVLLTITNDAWFAETSGSRQHLAHSVFRAVETGLPMLRNGNNSDTCLISPNGELSGLLYNEDSRFVRDARVYELPIWTDLPLTTYSRHGNCFAWVCVLITMITVGYAGYRALDRKYQLFVTVHGEDERPNST